MTTTELLNALGLIAAFVLSFAAAFALVVGLPIYGVVLLLRSLTRRR